MVEKEPGNSGRQQPGTVSDAAGKTFLTCVVVAIALFLLFAFMQGGGPGVFSQGMMSHGLSSDQAFVVFLFVFVAYLALVVTIIASIWE